MNIGLGIPDYGTGWWTEADQYYPSPAGSISESAYRAQSNANSQLVAQRQTGTSDRAPAWDGAPINFDPYVAKVKDWSLSTKIEKHKQAFALRNELPIRVKERLKQELNEERLKATFWREEVSAQDHLRYQTEVIYKREIMKYNKIKETIKQQRDYQEMVLKLKLTPPGGDVTKTKVSAHVLTLAVQHAMGDSYMEEPEKPKAADYEEVPEGKHDVCGDTYGKELTAGVDYLLEAIEATQMLKPLHKYMGRLRRFLSCRKPRGHPIIPYINDFNTRHLELVNDKTVNLKIPDLLVALLLLTFADITDSDYTIIMGRIDSEGGLERMTQDKMEDILKNILGARDTSTAHRAYVAEEGNYEEENYYGDWDPSYSDQWQQPSEWESSEYDTWASVAQALMTDTDPPLCPGEPTTLEDDEGCLLYTSDAADE